MDEEAIRNAFKTLSNAVNGGSSSKIARILADEYMRDHRTLQQNMVRTLYHFIKIVAEENTADPRNEASLEWFREVAGIEKGFPYI